MNVNRSALRACVVANLPNVRQFTYHGHESDDSDVAMSPLCGPDELVTDSLPPLGGAPASSDMEAL